ncbi:hypothetical protein MBRA1_001560 [Malassezia brasiliensis]|uniref:Uncharacterized protein n=1 Tax=Malassezia brasiliensis TaxID=1821822 RepID=A0AAF0INE9_9BASI|nr:hypothetical protein MBRA1_001560 [Malassezia brasiliensis]
MRIDDVKAALDDAAILTGDRDATLHIERARRSREQIMRGEGKEAGMQQVLVQRLHHFAQTETFRSVSRNLPLAQTNGYETELVRLQRNTGWLSLASLAQLHHLVVHAPTPAQQGSEPAALLGARDLGIVKQLLTASFAWLVVPLVEAYDAAYGVLFPTLASRMPDDARIHEVEEDETLWHSANMDLVRVARVFLALLQPGEPSASHTALPVSRVARTDVAVLVLRVYFVDVLRVLVRMSFGPTPKEFADDAQEAQRQLHALLEALPTSIDLAALRSVPALLRPEGVRSLLIGVLGANEADMLSGDIGDDLGDADTTFKRLDGATKLLTTPPKGMGRAAYYEAILPHVLSVLDPVTPQHTTPVHGMHRRAAAFTLMRMYERSADAVRNSLSPVVFDVLGANRASAAEVDRALRLLAAAVLLSPPSPDFIQFLVGTNAVRLFALDSFVDQAPAAKVAVTDETRSLETQRNEVREVLHTWLRLGAIHEVGDTLGQVLDKAGSADTAVWQSSKTGVHLVPQEYV